MADQTLLRPALEELIRQPAKEHHYAHDREAERTGKACQVDEILQDLSAPVLTSRSPKG